MTTTSRTRKRRGTHATGAGGSGHEHHEEPQQRASREPGEERQRHERGAEPEAAGTSGVMESEHEGPHATARLRGFVTDHPVISLALAGGAAAMFGAELLGAALVGGAIAWAARSGNVPRERLEHWRDRALDEGRHLLDRLRPGAHEPT